MFFFTDSARAQHERNRHKAQGIVRNHGATAIDYVRSQIDASAGEPRNRAHWRRVESHVKALVARETA